eukprot:scaffold79175_cov32-Prasinocladus_malaysianus.AAC.1
MSKEITISPARGHNCCDPQYKSGLASKKRKTDIQAICGAKQSYTGQCLQKFQLPCTVRHRCSVCQVTCRDAM